MKSKAKTTEGFTDNLCFYTSYIIFETHILNTIYNKIRYRKLFKLGYPRLDYFDPLLIGFHSNSS